MSFIESRGNVDPRLTPILRDDELPLVYKMMNQPVQQGGIAGGVDITGWATVSSKGDIPDAAGVITLRTGFVYELVANLQAKGYTIVPGAARYIFADNVTKANISFGTEALLLPANNPFSFQPQSILRLLYAVTAGDEDIVIRCRAANPGTHQLETFTTNFSIFRLGRV